MTKVTIDRELLERELLSVLDFSESNLRRVVDHLIDVGYTLAAPRQPEGDARLDERMKDAGMLSVAELLAGAPLDAFMKHAGVNDLATFAEWLEMRRGECIRMHARYDLGERDKGDDLYEWTIAHAAVFNEVHINFKAAHADAQRAIAELRGLTPELPPRPPEGEGMPRYGLRWNGPQQPVAVPMDDGYWTPWHLAEAERDTLRQQLAERDATIERLEAGIPRLQEQSFQMRQQRDKLAGLLREVLNWSEPDLEQRIKAALAEVKPCPESPAPTT